MASAASSNSSLISFVIAILLVGVIGVCIFFARGVIAKGIRFLIKIIISHKVASCIIAFVLIAGTSFSIYYYVSYMAPENKLINGWENEESTKEWGAIRYRFVFSESGNYYTPYTNYKIAEAVASISGQPEYYIVPDEEIYKVQGQWKFKRIYGKNHLLLYGLDSSDFDEPTDYTFEFDDNMLTLYDESGNVVQKLRDGGALFSHLMKNTSMKDNLK